MFSGRMGLYVVGMMGFVLALTSCRRDTACPPSLPSESCEGRSVVCKGEIHLSQLDAESRARLKGEVEAEIRDEMVAQWRKEWELSLDGVSRTADDKPLDGEGESKDLVKPDLLPPTQEIGRDSGGMKILREVFTTQISHRLPIDDRETFSVSDATVFCFVEISSSSEEERTITIRFTHSTGLSQSYSLPVGQSPAWRTWSKLNLTRSMTGTWLCEVFNEEETLLASKAFVVVESVQ